MPASRRASGVTVVVAVALLAAAVAIHADGAAAAATNVWLDERRVLNMAHGGGLAEVPQGTVYAYETAAARGANALEMDLHITLDGHVVAIHDSTVDRTTDGTGCVVAKTLDELKALDAAHTFVPGEGPRAGRPVEEYTMRGIATGEVAPPAGFEPDDFTIATLEEIFLAVPDATMIMELKPTEVYQDHDCPAFVESLPPEDRPDLAAEVARLIAEYGMTDRVMVASFIDDLMHRFQALAPEVDTSFPVGESVAVYLAFLAGDPLPNPNGHEAFQVPRDFNGIVLTEELVDYARAHGVAVHFWTINDPDEMAELLDWGVDGLITDVPEQLADLLADRGEPQPSVTSATVLTATVDGPTTPGQEVAFTATVRSAWPYPPVTGEVVLRTGDRVLAVADVADGRAELAVDDLSPGVHQLVAEYTGSPRVLSSTSASLTHQVVAPEPPASTPTTATGSASNGTPRSPTGGGTPARPVAADPRYTG